MINHTLTGLSDYDLNYDLSLDFRINKGDIIYLNEFFPNEHAQLDLAKVTETTILSSNYILCKCELIKDKL